MAKQKSAKAEESDKKIEKEVELVEFKKDQITRFGPFNWIYQCDNCSLEDAKKEGFFLRKEVRSMGLRKGEVVQLVSKDSVEHIVVK